MKPKFILHPSSFILPTLSFIPPSFRDPSSAFRVSLRAFPPVADDPEGFGPFVHLTSAQTRA